MGYKYAGDKIKRIEYQTIEEGRPKVFASFENGVVNTVEEYEFNDNRPVKIDAYFSYEAFGQSPQTPNYLISYNKIGDVSEIRRTDEPSDFFPEGQGLVVYKQHNVAAEREKRQYFLSVKADSSSSGFTLKFNGMRAELEELPLFFQCHHCERTTKDEVSLNDYGVRFDQLKLEEKKKLYRLLPKVVFETGNYKSSFSSDLHFLYQASYE